MITGDAPAPSGSAELDGVLTTVRSLAPAADDAERIERIRQFEVLKSAIAAAQLAEAAAFDTAQRTAAAVAGQPPARQGRG
ncbi:MAG: hypothetical protein INR67_17210, partial [Jatrophihabitans endophyticus]